MIDNLSLGANPVLAKRLSEGLAGLDLDLPAIAQSRLLAYLVLLQRWNRTYNLTAIRDPYEMLVQHILDSLAVLTLRQQLSSGTLNLPGRQMNVADVGSGAGLPGIPWAIAEPDWKITSIEAVEKKSAFQRQVKIELELSNFEVLARRVESVAGGTFDLIVARAFSSLADFVRLAGHLATSSGCLCAMKGVRPDSEIENLPAGWDVTGLHEIRVPGLAAERHILLLRKS